METTVAAPVATEAAPTVTQPVEVQAQPQTQTEAPKPAAEGVQVDRGQRLAEITEMIAKDPEKKLDDADLDIYMEGQSGKLKPKESEPVKVETKEKVIAPAEDAMTQTLKRVGAKSVDELPAKIDGLLKQISGKDAQAVATLTRELDGFKAKENIFNGASQLIADLKSGNPKAIAYLQKELGVTLPSGSSPTDKPFTEEADLLTDGALSRAWEREKALEQKLNQFESKLTEGEKRVQAEQTQQRAKSQVVDEALAVAQFLPELKDLPNLRNRILEFQAGKDDPGLAPLAEVFDFVVQQHKDKGLVLDPETAFFTLRGKNMDAMIAAAEEKGRKEAYNYKPNKSMSQVATEDPQPQTFTKSQYENMGLPYGHRDKVEIPDQWYTNGRLDQSKIPRDAWSYLGLG